MKSNRFESWLQKIFHTQEKEISCSECFDQVSRFVDLELAGAEPEVKMAEVVQHLQQCPACREEYETLRDLQTLDDEGRQLSMDDLKRLIRND